MEEFDLSPAQSRMARAGLNMSQVELAKRAGVSRGTVAFFEREERGTTLSNRKRIGIALSEAVVFVAPVEGMHGGGVLLREKAADIG